MAFVNERRDEARLQAGALERSPLSFDEAMPAGAAGGSVLGYGITGTGAPARPGDSYAPWDEVYPSRPFRSRTSSTAPDKPACGNLACGGGWRAPWRTRRRAVFEQGWGCSARCLREIVRRSLRRERGDPGRASEAETPHQHRLPLGLLMLSQGWITQAQLRAALTAQRAAGEGRIGEWLVRACGVSRALVTRGLAAQWSCPVLPIDGYSPAAMSLTMPRLLVEELGLLPLRVAGSRILYVAFKERLDASAAFAVERMSGLKVISGLLEDAQFDAARGRLLESDFVRAERSQVIDSDTLVEKIARVLEETQPVDARIVRVHQHYWLRAWLERGAYSDVGSLPRTVEDVADTVFTVGSHA